MRRLKCLLLLTNSTTADVNVSYYVLIGDFIERLWVCSESKEHIIDETRSYQNVVRLNVSARGRVVPNPAYLSKHINEEKRLFSHYLYLTPPFFWRDEFQAVGCRCTSTGD